MDIALWSVIIGSLLVIMALSGSVLERLPVSTAMFYLLVGAGVSPLGIGLLWAHPLDHAVVLERLTEVVVLMSLFTAGLKLSPGLGDKRWRLPLRLAVTSMLLTVALIAAVGVLLLGLPLGAAVLLGAILAPTDPVLASDVQVRDPEDRDRLRFALTGEGGLNDGTAFPMVLLGLGLLGLHDLGGGWRWMFVDVAWGVAAGLAIGAFLGSAVGALVLYLRRKHREAVGLDDFLALGLIGLSYGTALMLDAYGFLAVFAAGVALRQLEQRETAATARKPGQDAGANRKAMAQAVVEAVQATELDPDHSAADRMAVHPRHAPAFMARAVLGFNEKLERIGEVAVVIAIGALLWAVPWRHEGWWFVPLLLFVIRPLSVALGLAGSDSLRGQRVLIGWFGIRGIGSLYYLMYAINHGLAGEHVDMLMALTLSTVVASIVAHGVSVTPLMALYERARAVRVRKAPRR